LFAGFLTVLIAFGDVFPGLIAYALNPDLPVADEAFTFAVRELIPVGLRGLVFAGLLGAILSTVESLGNAAATIFTLDLYGIWSPGATEQRLIRVGRVAAVIVLAAGALWAPVVMGFGHIFAYFQECWAFIAIPVVVIFLLGVLWKGMTEQAAWWTLLLSFPMLLFPYLLRLGGPSWNAYNVAGIALVATFLFAIALSLVTRKSPITGFAGTRSESAPEESQPFYANTLFWAVALSLLYIGLYTYFW
jgi:SSS family solute:Na+ symporter